MFLRNFDNVCAVSNGVDNKFGDGVFGDTSVICKTTGGKLQNYASSAHGNPIGFPLTTNDYGANGAYTTERKLAMSFGSDVTEPTYEDYTYTTVTKDKFTRQNTSRTTTYDAEADKYTITIAMDFYNSSENDVVAHTFVLTSDLINGSSNPFIFYKELLKDENGELAPVTFPAKSYKHVEFKYTVQGHTYKPVGVSVS